MDWDEVNRKNKILNKMKKIKIIIYLLLAGLLFLLVNITSAQSVNRMGNDMVVFLNGDIKEGRVTAFTSEKVKFIHCDETLDYEFNKKEIEKIVYASGRTEFIAAKRIKVTGGLINTKNRVAVMPMRYVADGNPDRAEYMRTYLQEMAIGFLSRSAAELKFVDAAEINAILLKNDIAESNMQQYTPGELANILQVEYVIIGSVMQDKGNLVTSVSNNGSKKQTIEQNSNKVKINGKNNSHSTEVTHQDIETQVSLFIYSESGQKIYDNSRRSILSDADAYKAAIKYMLRRTPLYKR
jgi:hypothetical protein